MKKSPAQQLIEKIYDKDFRAQLKQNPKKCLQEHGYSNNGNDADITYKVVESSPAVYYVAFPDNNTFIQQDISNIHAAGDTVGSVGSVSSVSSASSAGSLTSSFSSASSAGSAGSLGTAKT